MEKNRFVLLTVILVLLISTAFAGPPDKAGGEWSYIVTDVEVKEAGRTMFMASDDHGEWTGTFEGLSTEVGMVVSYPSGKWSFDGTLSFDGTVDAKSGTLEMSIVGQCCDEQGWDGQWVILSGTEELANLRGQGTWFGPGAGGPFVWGTVEYAGNYHFEP